MAEIKCIDVSEWQGNIDWKKVKAAGITCAILRAGFGRVASQKDSSFEKNYKNAKAAGIKLGAYWYSYAVDKADARKEATACLEVIKGKTFELPIYFDVEESSQTKLGKTTLTSMANAFCTDIKNAGYVPGVYANLNFFKNYLNYTSLKKYYSIWLAQYYVEPQLESDIWQYTSEGKVNGIGGNVDMNIIYNSKIIKSAETQKPAESTTAKPAETTAAVTVRKELKVGETGLDILLLKTMLLVAHDFGLCTVRMTKGTDYAGPGMGTAIKEVQKAVGLKETGVADADFVIKMYDAIAAKYPLPGDFNKDGKLNVKDVSDIQRELAKLGGDE